MERKYSLSQIGIAACWAAVWALVTFLCGRAAYHQTLNENLATGALMAILAVLCFMFGGKKVHRVLKSPSR